MKNLTALFTFSLFTFPFSLSAAVPLRWTVETSRAQPATFESYQGETLALEASLQSYGKPLAAPSEYAFYWQTNGMSSAWWSVSCASASSPTNVLHAVWSPDMDVGAKAYNCFIGQTGTIFHAAFQLRLRPSPGATPNELPLPQKVIDFSQVTVLNPPWSGGGGVDTNAVERIANKAVETNAVTVGLSSSVSGLVSSVSSLSSDVSSLSSSVSGLESSKRDLTDNVFPDGVTDIAGTWQGYMIGPNILKLGMEMGDPIVCIDTTSYYALGYLGLMTIGSDWPYVSGRIEVKSGEGGSASIVVNGTNVMDYISTKAGTNEVASIVTNDVIATISDEWMMDGQPLNTDVWEMFWDGSVWVLVGEHESANYPIQGGHSRNDTRIVYQQGVLTRSATYKNALGLAYERDFDRRISAADPAFSNAVLAVGLNIDTNSVAVLNEIAATFGGFPVTGTATTVGGLLAALAAAVAWLRKRAAHLDSDGLSDETFATDLPGKPVAISAVNNLIDAKIAPANADLETALNGEGN